MAWKSSVWPIKRLVYFYYTTCIAIFCSSSSKPQLSIHSSAKTDEEVVYFICHSSLQAVEIASHMLTVTAPSILSPVWRGRNQRRARGRLSQWTTRLLQNGWPSKWIWFGTYSAEVTYIKCQVSTCSLSLQVLANPWATGSYNHQGEAAGQGERRGPRAAGSHGVPPVWRRKRGRRGDHGGGEGPPGRSGKAPPSGAARASPRRSGTHRAGQQDVSLNTHPPPDPGLPCNPAPLPPHISKPNPPSCR